MVIAVLAILAYLPAFHISFIADDFPQIQMSRHISQAGGLTTLLSDSANRFRSTFFLLTWAIDRTAGLDPVVYHGVAVALHIFCCWLIYALGTWRLIGPKIALIAACFFAVFEGHQEAVFWYSAAMETLLFFFGLAAVVCFIQWLRGANPRYYGMALVAFILAAFSKESAYIFVPLMLLPAFELSRGDAALRKRAILGLLPFAALATAFIVWIAMARMGNARFGDGSFALTPHFFRVIGESFGRLTFVWATLAVAVLVYAKEYVHLAIYSFVWMLLGLIPYSFLTYLNRVPSRHTYLASAGLAILVAAALVCIWERLGGRAVLAIAAIILMVNVAILWRKKAEQFRARALPTDMLINAVRHASGPIHIRCYPYIDLVAEAAAQEFGGTVVMEPDGSKDKLGGKCMNFWYKDGIGNVREVFVPPARLP